MIFWNNLFGLGGFFFGGGEVLYPILEEKNVEVKKEGRKEEWILPSLVATSGDICEEDLVLWIWKTASKKLFLNVSSTLKKL